MSESDKSEIIIAKWSDRFFAFVIDMAILLVALIIVSTAIYITIPLQTSFYDFDADNSMDVFPFTYLITFTYFLTLEYKTGQTVGKKVLNLKMVAVDGKKPSISGVAISSLGKTFILPIDLLIGLLISADKKQRMCNKIGNTIVIKIKEPKNDDLEYRHD